MKDKWSQISGQWKQFVGDAKKQWGELTSDELAQVKGSRKTLVSLLQKRYDISKKAADKQITTWVNSLNV